MFAGDVLAVFFAVIVGGFSLGQAGPNVEGLIVASAAAGEVFETIDRVRGGEEEGKMYNFYFKYFTSPLSFFSPFSLGASI